MWHKTIKRVLNKKFEFKFKVIICNFKTLVGIQWKTSDSITGTKENELHFTNTEDIIPEYKTL